MSEEAVSSHHVLQHHPYRGFMLPWMCWWAVTTDSDTHNWDIVQIITMHIVYCGAVERWKNFKTHVCFHGYFKCYIRFLFVLFKALMSLALKRKSIRVTNLNVKTLLPFWVLNCFSVLCRCQRRSTDDENTRQSTNVETLILLGCTLQKRTLNPSLVIQHNNLPPPTST